MPEIIIFVVALLAAIRGADWVGRASINFAKRLGVSSFVIGATFVAIATTLPELTVALISGVVNKNPLYGLGNVLGSPIINIGLILGGFFILNKKHPSLGYYSRALNIFIIVTAIIFLVSLFRPIGGLFSVLLIGFGIVFLFLEFLLIQRTQTFLDEVENRFEKFISFFHLVGSKDVVLEFVFGTGLLLFGSKFLVDSGTAIANSLHVDNFFISATILALGTSTPELITMINSLFHNRMSLSIGNLVGASVLNLTLGVGFATVATPAKLPIPFTYLFFITMLALGLVGLIALWQKFRIEVVGGILVTIAVLFLITISILEFGF